MQTHPKPTRRRLWPAIALGAVLACGNALAQSWPAKPITLVVPFAAGGTTDVLARALGEKLSHCLLYTSRCV